MIERRVLVKAGHFDRPFNRLAFAVEHQRTICLSRHRHEAPVKPRREIAVDVELRAASGEPPVERRIIQKRIAHRALDLDGAIAGEEHNGCMGLNPAHRRAAIGRGIAQDFHTASWPWFGEFSVMLEP